MTPLRLNIRRNDLLIVVPRSDDEVDSGAKDSQRVSVRVAFRNKTMTIHAAREEMLVDLKERIKVLLLLLFHCSISQLWLTWDYLSSECVWRASAASETTKGQKVFTRWTDSEVPGLQRRGGIDVVSQEGMEFNVP